VRDSIVMLNSIINLDNRYIEEFEFNIKNLEKLSAYFVKFFKLFQNYTDGIECKMANASSAAFQLYSIIYLTTIIISETKKRSD
jgi:hypothetical protein